MKLKVCMVGVFFTLFIVPSFVFAQELVIQDGHNSNITALEFDPVNKRLYSIDESGKLISWDMDSRMIYDKFNLPNSNSISLSDQDLSIFDYGKKVAFNTFDLDRYHNPSNGDFNLFYDLEKKEIVRQWSQTPFKFIKTKSQHYFLGVADKYVYFTFYGTNSSQNRSLQFDTPVISATGDDRYILIGLKNGVIKCFDFKTLELLWQKKFFDASVFDLDLVSNGNQGFALGKKEMYSRKESEYMMVFDLNTGKQIKKVIPGSDRGKRIKEMVMSPDQQNIALRNNVTEVLVYNFASENVYFEGSLFPFTSLECIEFVSDTDLALGGHNATFEEPGVLYIMGIHSGYLSHQLNPFIRGLDEQNEIDYYPDGYSIFYPRTGSYQLVDLTKMEINSFSSSFWHQQLHNAFMLKKLPTKLKMGFGNQVTYNPDEGFFAIWVSDMSANFAADPFTGKEESHFVLFDVAGEQFIKHLGPYDFKLDDKEPYRQLVWLSLDQQKAVFAGNIKDFRHQVKGSYNMIKDIYVVDLNSGKEMGRFEVDASVEAQVSPDGKYLSFLDSNWNIRLFDFQTMTEIYQDDVRSFSATPYFFTKDGQYLYYSDNKVNNDKQYGSIRRYALTSGDKEIVLDSIQFFVSGFAANGPYLAIGMDINTDLSKWKENVDSLIQVKGFQYFKDPNILLLDLDKDEAIGRLKASSESFWQMFISDSLLIAKEYENQISMAPLSGLSDPVRHYPGTHESNVFYNGQYYYASKEGLKYIALKNDKGTFPIEAFDHYFNRPDILLKDLNEDHSTYYQKLKRAVEKRKEIFELNKGELADLDSDFLPEIALLEKGKIPYVTQEERLQIRIKVSQGRNPLSHISVFVNGVKELFNGKPFLAIKEEVSLDVRLNEGQNEIKIIAVDDEGLESFPVQFALKYTAPQELKPDLYIVTLGVSDYKDDNFDLVYASKDAYDLQKTFYPYDTSYVGDKLFKYDKSSFSYPADYYGEVKQLLLTDEQVTKEQLNDVSTFLSEVKEEDIVLFFISGHGMLNDDKKYYYAAYDMDFDSPSKYGIAYQDLMNLLDHSKSRKRVLFMDTCFSGDVDQTDDGGQPKGPPDTTTENTPITVNWKRGATGNRIDSNINDQESFELMKTLFSDQNTNGTIVISAASGLGFALENEEWSNGVFTYAIIDGLVNKKADTDSDYKIYLSELREYILNQVKFLTNGKQVPTNRMENLQYDFRIW